ncbi:MAG: hypothetical protein RIQ79_2488 [Verrucomicrobiota bacterium]
MHSFVDLSSLAATGEQGLEMRRLFLAGDGLRGGGVVRRAGAGMDEVEMYLYNGMISFGPCG